VTSLLLLADAAPLSLEMRLPLSIMNFLEFAIWGAWFVVLGNYLDALGFSRKHIGRIYATIPIGSIISPMFVGAIADRYFNSEQLMGALHLVGPGSCMRWPKCERRGRSTGSCSCTPWSTRRRWPCRTP